MAIGTLIVALLIAALFVAIIIYAVRRAGAPAWVEKAVWILVAVLALLFLLNQFGGVRIW
jgi:uncharacterized protein (DUF983 family)